jgi:hypothetical protein
LKSSERTPKSSDFSGQKIEKFWDQTASAFIFPFESSTKFPTIMRLQRNNNLAHRIQ